MELIQVGLEALAEDIPPELLHGSQYFGAGEPGHERVVGAHANHRMVGNEFHLVFLTPGAVEDVAAGLNALGQVERVAGKTHKASPVKVDQERELAVCRRESVCGIALHCNEHI